MNRKTKLSIVGGAVLTFVVAACDFSPSSPFAGFEAEQQQGATLNGQFQQSGVAAASRQSVAPGYNAQRTFASASDTDATPTVVMVYDAEGDEIGSVDINADGSFTLRGLPDSFTLVFVDADGNTVGDPMGFEGVKPNQEIDIVVAVEDGEVVLLEESRTGIDHEGSSGIEIDGTVQNIDDVMRTLDVDVYHVLTIAGGTSIRKGNRQLTFEDLDDGDQVHVRGVFDEDGNVVASEIKLQEEEEEEVDDLDDEGKVTLCHTPPGNPDNKKTITVGESAVPAHLAHGDTLGPC
jgi:hypothetical protein